MCSTIKSSGNMSKNVYPSQLNVESCLDLTFYTTEKDGKLSAKLYDKHDYFDLHTVNVISTLISIPTK